MIKEMPKRKRGRPLSGAAPMTPAERQRRRRKRLIEAAQVGKLTRVYADWMSNRLDMAEEQIRALSDALRQKNSSAYDGLVVQIDFSIRVLRRILPCCRKRCLRSLASGRTQILSPDSGFGRQRRSSCACNFPSASGFEAQARLVASRSRRRFLHPKPQRLVQKDGLLWVRCIRSPSGRNSASRSHGGSDPEQTSDASRGLSSGPSGGGGGGGGATGSGVVAAAAATAWPVKPGLGFGSYSANSLRSAFSTC